MAVTKVVMPKLSDSMETGRILKWLKREGDAVQGGDVLAEVETDKADVEMEAFGTGVLRRIVVPAGALAAVGALIAVIAEPADDIAAVLAEVAAPPPVGAAAVPAGPAVPAASGGPVLATMTALAAVPGPGRSERVKASPLARKVAARAGVDLKLVQGTGPGGRIVRRDVETAAAAPPMPTVPVVVAAPAAAAAEFEDVALSQMRAVIAKRLGASKAPVPHFYVTSEVAMDRAMALRAELNALDAELKISVNDLVVRAAALALLEHPGVNAAFQGETLRVHRRAHIGIAVALEDGLITPVLRDCEQKSLARIAAESRDLAARARARKLKATELSGGTFSISNLGMFDVAVFSAIINPPEGAILAVGSVRTVPVVIGDTVGVGERMAVTLSCDHRVMDGAVGARFLQTLKRLLEAPLRLLV